MSRKILEAQLVKIILADLSRQILAPIVLDPLEHDDAAGDEILDPVGPGAERHFQRRCGDVALAAVAVGAFPPVLRQHRELPDDLRQFAVARLVEGELDLALADLLGLDRRAGNRTRRCGLFVFSASNEKMTSSGVTGWPSCQRASVRSR